MIYAYTTTETCTRHAAALPGEYVDLRPVSRHPDYTGWPWGKRETLRRIHQGRNTWERQTAARVARLRGWGV